MSLALKWLTRAILSEVLLWAGGSGLWGICRVIWIFIYFALAVLFIEHLQYTVRVNPPGGSCSCDARMDGCRVYGLLISHIRPSSTHHMMLFTPVNFALLHSTQDIKEHVNPFCAQVLHPYIIWCHRMTVALRGLSSRSIFHVIMSNIVLLGLPLSPSFFGYNVCLH